jgi:aminoglycoside phosphotransferase (APT) family kinase protein
MDLIKNVTDRLRGLWGTEVAVSAVRARLKDRAVFDIVAPGRCPGVIKADASSVRLARELLALRAAADGGIPVPAVTVADTGSPGFLVLTRAEGGPLSGAAPGAWWAEAGRHLRRLHDLPPPPGIPHFSGASRDWRTFMLGWADEAACAINRPGMLSPCEAEWLRSHLAGAVSEMPDPPSRLLHGDCQPEHFLIGPDDGAVTALVDFGDARVGDPAWDFAVLTLRCPRRLDDVLRGYDPDSHLREHVTRWAPAYRFLRLAGLVRWRAENRLSYRSDIQSLRHQCLRAL